MALCGARMKGVNEADYMRATSLHSRIEYLWRVRLERQGTHGAVNDVLGVAEAGCVVGDVPSMSLKLKQLVSSSAVAAVVVDVHRLDAELGACKLETVGDRVEQDDWKLQESAS